MFCVPISFSDNLLYDFFVKKQLKTFDNVTYIFCTISGSKIMNEHFFVSFIIVHSLPPEISVQYLLFVTIVIFIIASATVMLSISLSLLLTLSLLLSLELSSELYIISSISVGVRTSSVIAMPPLSLQSQYLNEAH